MEISEGYVRRRLAVIGHRENTRPVPNHVKKRMQHEFGVPEKAYFGRLSSEELIKKTMQHALPLSSQLETDTQREQNYLLDLAS